MDVRVIPCLLLKNQGLVKTIKFKKDIYIGDPINAIKIFNDKEVDELVFLDIMASKENRPPNMGFIKDLAGECFMPFAYGGGISTLDQIGELNSIGVEKVIINSAAFSKPGFIEQAVDRFGSSTIVISIDVKKDLFGDYTIMTNGNTIKVRGKFNEILQKINDWRVGEVIVNSIDRDGTMQGYDEVLIKKSTEILDMPVVALGGAGSIQHFKNIIDKGGVLAVAAGSLFVFYGPHKAVLIQYPSKDELLSLSSINHS
jgi:cyclase